MDPIGKNGQLLGLLLDATVARQRAVAKNLANVDTPGYRAKDVRFSRDLGDALAKGGGEGLGGIEIETVEREGPVNENGNTVDLDREIAELSGNALAYQTLITLVSMKTNQARSAIAGRSV
jgi:flagellar basal-body rod protein FlgB